MNKALSTAIFAVAGLAGLLAILYPFILADRPPVSAPFLTVSLIVLSLVILLLEVQSQLVGAKVVATLGVLVAVSSVLRFVEVAIPGPGGFSPVFAPIILAGYVFGARFGFLMGAMTLLVSALITGGVGPWLPYQMFAAGWVGLTAGWLPHPRQSRHELALLGGFGFAWGLLYGAILNLATWPFVAGETILAGNLRELLGRYALYYLSTSLLWDLVRSAGNVALIWALGLPTVRALARFHARFRFAYLTPEQSGGGA